MLTRPVWYTSMVDQSHSEFDFFWVDWVKMVLLPIPLKGLIKVMPNLISQGLRGSKWYHFQREGTLPCPRKKFQKRMFRQRMAQIGITQKETSTASQPAKVASQTKHQTQPASQPTSQTKPTSQATKYRSCRRK